MNRHDLEHVHPPFPELGEVVELFLETRAREGVLLYEKDGELHQEPLTRVPGGLRARVAVHASPFRYAFRLPQGYLGSHGLEKTLPRYDRFFHLLAGPLPPPWALGAVYYQIFPDRFRRGRPGLAPKEGAWRLGGKPIRTKAWHEPPGPEGAHEFYGGDLWGILEALPYLEALGVEVLYLTPIFQSPSSHRYDTEHYLRVDPHLGGEEALQALYAALEARGMRLVLDGVFNHVGATHPWFQKALQDPESPERGMFTFYPDGTYASFWGVKSMPKLDYASPLVQERFVFGKEAPIRRWLRLAHGWRLDVAHSLGEGGTNRKNAHWLRALARAAKEAREEALVLGELSYDPTPTLRAHTLDGAMHYAGFAHPVMEWLSGRDVQGRAVALGAEEAWQALWDHYQALPLQLRPAMYTFVSSHDIPRALWRLRGDEARFKLAYALLFAFPGSPAIYYGDEVGLSQANPHSLWRGDPYCRAPFPWDEGAWKREILSFVKRLVALKKRHPALRLGGLWPLKAPKGVLAFRRRYGGEEVWAFFAPQGARLRLPRGVDLLAGEEVGGEVEASHLLFQPLS
ncbi:Maltodextrin glucosidase [Thermus sp. CCB_US3_UF1]|uniref:glycoside hydrolase family 13 protein n=1 Tax=Thermus sp. CCB_US3_UF1 TaxID=1111069 RepID=UPI0002389BA5|nr:glycoside hydrolase family 13 protein [Thermus sp. CCB_US3_UF1]AEV15401.1 Maltodextrin glucosidase [Thermus sp. CCB_US3_UF1]